MWLCPAPGTPRVDAWAARAIALLLLRRQEKAVEAAQNAVQCVTAAREFQELIAWLELFQKARPATAGLAEIRQIYAEAEKNYTPAAAPEETLAESPPAPSSDPLAETSSAHQPAIDAQAEAELREADALYQRAFELTDGRSSDRLEEAIQCVSDAQRRYQKRQSPRAEEAGRLVAEIHARLKKK